MAKKAAVKAMSGGAAEATLSDRAYGDLEAMIVTLQLPPGSAVSEAALSQRLGIGRTPIREALQRLARERLITILPRRFSPPGAPPRAALRAAAAGS